jgi:hypothetical protein
MTMQQDKSILRWGGVAGIAGSVLFLVVFVIVGVFAGPEPAGPAGPIARFPEIRVARTVENGLYLAVLILWVPVALALSRRLRERRPASALFGGALNLVGLAVLAAGALPHVVTLGLSDRYHATGVSAGERETLVLQWQATQGMFDALLTTGLLVMAAGITLLGPAMVSLGRMSGSIALLLGLTAVAAGIATLIYPGSPAAALGIFALIGFHLIAGWKVCRTAAS